MGQYKDSKGVSITICIIPSINKVITRYNYTEFGQKKRLIKIFGIEYNSFHSEIRVLLTILRNEYYLKNIQKSKYLKLINLRYNKNMNMSYSSKPCVKCQNVLRIFKEKFGLKYIEVEYFERNTKKTLRI